MAGGARSLARCLLALAASGGGSVLEGYAMFAAFQHFVSQILEIGYNLVISPACVMILGVRQDFVNEQTQF